MKIKIITVGTQMPSWVTEGYEEYIKRLSSHLKIELIEIPLNKRLKTSNVNKLIEQEGSKMLNYVQADDFVIALDVKGKPWSTEELAQQLQHWQQNGKDIALLIGGPEGLAPAIKEKVHQTWSFSKLTFPHPLVRVILVEQLYRAWSINAGHPYHRM